MGKRWAKMATMVKLQKHKDEIVEETYRRINEAEEQRAFEYRAVLRIQAWFRAQRVRSYINHLNSCARLIQRRWRGFYTRKYIFNYYSRKRYLEGLMIKNEIVRNELEEYAENQEQMAQWKREAEEKKELDEQARKNHYLLSTEVLPGIYNSPYKPYPDEMEYHLRNAKPRTPNKEKSKGHPFDPAWKKYDLPTHSPLPPVQSKPQGPFRDPRDVQKQRYKPFQPTLRVATNYYSLEEAREHMKAEEWVTRLNDNLFEPFSKKPPLYQPLLHTTSKYGHLSYGTEYFREEFPERFAVTQNFQSVVPPIPIFEKLNDTYSQGQA